MTPNPAIVNSVEQLGYRVTTGDVAVLAGLDINVAQQGLLTLASDAGANLQVSETGQIVYFFPKNFRSILRNKYWKIKFQEFWEKVWNILFYLIRISFGIVLIASILLMLVAILVIVVGASFNNNDDDRPINTQGGTFFAPGFWISPDIFWFFDPGYEKRSYERSLQPESAKKMNFLESVFSFLFGDGNPNFDLEKRRWQLLATAIANNNGAVIAEQIAPYLDPESTNKDNEDYMIPVLAKFNGYPEVSPEGEIIYYFPDLQVTAKKRTYQKIPAYLQEQLWRFSQADSGQIMLAVGLGALNFIFALVLSYLLKQDNITSQIGGIVGFVQSIYYLLIGYATSFLAIPLTRYFWVQSKNKKIKNGNSMREQKANIFEKSSPKILQKINFARNFGKTEVVSTEKLIYTTETDLLEQELDRAEQIDEEWRSRLESDS